MNTIMETSTRNTSSRSVIPFVLFLAGVAVWVEAVAGALELSGPTAVWTRLLGYSLPMVAWFHYMSPAAARTARTHLPVAVTVVAATGLTGLTSVY